MSGLTLHSPLHSPFIHTSITHSHFTYTFIHFTLFSRVFSSIFGFSPYFTISIHPYSMLPYIISFWLQVSFLYMSRHCHCHTATRARVGLWHCIITCSVYIYSDVTWVHESSGSSLLLMYTLHWHSHLSPQILQQSQVKPLNIVQHGLWWST